MKIIARLAAALALALFALPASAQEDCADWNTDEFFRDATAETVTACLEAGVGVNPARDDTGPLEDRGNTPLHFASRYTGDPTVIAALLAAGADVDARNRLGRTPLHLAAARYRNPVVVAKLAEAGADLNARDNGGNTPLHAAWRNPNPAVARLLLETGADPDAVNGKGQVADPMDCAYWNTREFARIATAEAAADCLAGGADVDARDKNGNTPLLLATWDEPGASGPPASEYLGIVTLLLEAGADVNAGNDAGITSLHHAAGGRHGDEFGGWFSPGWVEYPAIVAALLKAGADVNARTDGGDDGVWFLSVPGTTPLHRAAEVEAPETIRLLLQAGADVHLRDDNGETPMLLAAYGAIRNRVVFEILLEAGADVRGVLMRVLDGVSSDLAADEVIAVVRRLLELGAYADTRGSHMSETPLYRAAALGDIPEIVAILVDAGARVNVRGRTGKSPLHAAAVRGSLATIAALVARGAEVDARDNQGETPLHQAVEAKKPANVSALLEAGADAQLRTPHGDTPLHLAATRLMRRVNKDDPLDPDTLMVVGLVAAGADVDARNDRGETPFHVAMRTGHGPVVDQLLELGADPGAEDDLGRVPRPTICHWTRTEYFRGAPWQSVLGCLQAGADVHARDKDGKTPLHHLSSAVIQEGYPFARVSAAFVEAGAEVNARDLAGGTPLHDAIGYWGGRSTPVAAALLEAGADVNAYDSVGRTPLHQAASHANDTMVSLLVEAGADVNARDRDGRTPLHRALDQDNPRIVARLLELGADPMARDAAGRIADPTSCVRWNSRSFFLLASAETVAYCIEDGVDVNARSGGLVRRGSTPLHFASVWARNPAAISQLLEAGADVNARDEDGYSPLHRAARMNDNPEMIAVLLDAGAEVDAWAKGFRIDWGWDATPLHEAAGVNENPAVTAALLEAGANVNALSSRVGTPLHQAARTNPNPGVAALLLEAGADVNARGNAWGRCCWVMRHNVTPLHQAASGNPAMFIFLLHARADPAAPDDDGRTPMDYAREQKALQELEVVKRSGG